MKSVRFNASVLKDTNRVVSATEEDWSFIRSNTIFKWRNDNLFYKTVQTNEIKVVREFNVLSSNLLKIAGKIGVELQVGDSLEIEFDQFTIKNLAIITGGKNYKKGQHIILDNLQATTNIRSFQRNFPVIEVKQVSDGIITELGIVNGGRLFVQPAQSIKYSDLEFFCESEKTNASTVSHTIKQITPKDKDTEIVLDYPLIDAIQNGRFSAKKWELFLHSPALQDRFNEPYEISRDFTPNYQIPFIAKNSLQPVPYVNEALLQIDGILKDLQRQVDELKKS